MLRNAVKTYIELSLLQFKATPEKFETQEVHDSSDGETEYHIMQYMSPDRHIFTIRYDFIERKIVVQGPDIDIRRRYEFHWLRFLSPTWWAWRNMWKHVRNRRPPRSDINVFAEKINRLFPDAIDNQLLGDKHEN